MRRLKHAAALLWIKAKLSKLLNGDETFISRVVVAELHGQGFLAPAWWLPPENGLAVQTLPANDCVVHPAASQSTSSAQQQDLCQTRKTTEATSLLL